MNVMVIHSDGEAIIQWTTIGRGKKNKVGGNVNMLIFLSLMTEVKRYHLNQTKYGDTGISTLNSINTKKYNLIN